MWIDRPGHVALSYKNWSTDSDWEQKTDDGEPLEILKRDAEGNQMVPSGVPDIVAPDYERKNCLDDIKKNIQRLRLFLRYTQHEWWSKLFENPGASFLNQCDWYFDELRIQMLPEGHTEDRGEQQEVFSPLQLALDKERSIPKVQTGKRKAKPSKKQPTPTKLKRPVGEGMGYMVAVEDEDEGELCVGKITSVGRTTVDIIMYTGSHNGVWSPVQSQQGKQYIRTIPKASIKDDMFFSLTQAGNLPARIKIQLKNK